MHATYARMSMRLPVGARLQVSRASAVRIHSREVSAASVTSRAATYCSPLTSCYLHRCEARIVLELCETVFESSQEIRDGVEPLVACYSLHPRNESLLHLVG